MTSSTTVSARSRALLVAAASSVVGALLLASPAASAAPPPNDDRAQAQAISGPSGSVEGTNVGATADPDTGHTDSVWFTWTASKTGLMTFRNTAHYLEVYAGGATGDLVTLSYPVSRLCDASGYEPSCRFVWVRQGQTYAIEVWDEEYTVPFTLTWSRITTPPNDDFANAAPIVRQSNGRSPTFLTFPTVADAAAGQFATIEPGEQPAPLPDGPGEHSVWFTWTSPWDGTAALDVRVGPRPSQSCYSPDTALEVLTGPSVDDLDLVAADYVRVDENCDSPNLTFRITRGTAYFLRVDADGGPSPISGTIDITPDCLTSGTEGDDVLVGTPGDDVLCGLGGNDVIIASAGDDVIEGGPGSDTITYLRARRAVDVSLIRGVATGQGEDTLSSLENITGSGYDDRLEGNNLASIIKGRRGDDTLIGNGGDNVLYGRAGDDTLIGGYGEDFLGGGSGNDSCDGGYGPGDRARACETTVRVP